MTSGTGRLIPFPLAGILNDLLGLRRRPDAFVCRHPKPDSGNNSAKGSPLRVFATGLCHGSLPRVFATGLCHGSLPRVFATGPCHGPRPPRPTSARVSVPSASLCAKLAPVPRGSRPLDRRPIRDPTYDPPRGTVDGGVASTPEVCRLRVRAHLNLRRQEP